MFYNYINLLKRGAFDLCNIVKTMPVTLSLSQKVTNHVSYSHSKRKGKRKPWQAISRAVAIFN
jgi:hypothetical protein